MTILVLVFSLFNPQGPGQGGQGGQGRPPGPPPEAIEACQGMSAGDACSFEGRRGSESGSCFKPSDAPADAPLACRPDGHEGPPPRGER